MFSRFNKSARTVMFRARDNAVIEERPLIEPRHILIALKELHPELFARIAEDPADVERIQREVGMTPGPAGISHAQQKVRMSERSKRVLSNAAKEARSSSHYWEVDERHLLLGLLRNPDCPMIALLVDRGMTSDVVRQRLEVSKREEWRKVLQTELSRWSSMSSDDVLTQFRSQDVYEIVAGSKRYQVEVALLEDTPEYLHVSIAVDDGSLPASTRPEASSFLCRKSQTKSQ